MTINWLYTTTLDLSLLIGLVLLLRPFVRRILGANVAYWLWAIPLIRIFLPERLPRPEFFSTNFDLATTVSLGDTEISPLFIPEVLVIPEQIPVLAVWITGIFCCLTIQAYLSNQFRLTIAETRTDFRAGSEQLLELMGQFKFGDDRLHTSTMAHAPFVHGLITQRIYLPENFDDAYSREEQYWVLRHELTHIKRGDLWIQLLAEVVRAVFWFNPIVHLALVSFRDDQEFACDQTVLRSSNSQDKYHYGKALLTGSSPRLVPSMLHFFTQNKERFYMLARHKNSVLSSSLGLALCFLVGVFTLTSAPESIAQGEARPIFDEMYDASAPAIFSGRIVRVDYGEHFMLLHVDAVNDDGSITQWVVEGGSYEDMHAAGLDSNALFPGRPVTIRGYKTIDPACSPKCRLNGRDISFDDN